MTEEELMKITNAYRPVTKAPSLQELWGGKQEPYRENMARFDLENQSRYLASDGAGAIYLIRNPAMMAWESALGRECTRPAPVLFMASNSPQDEKKGRGYR